MKWMPMSGRFDVVAPNELVFRGDRLEMPLRPADAGAGEQQEPIVIPAIGMAACDQSLAEGTIATRVRFDDVTSSACQIVVGFDPETKGMIAAGIVAFERNWNMFAIREWTPAARGAGPEQSKWVEYDLSGARGNLRAAEDYQMEVRVGGSRLTLMVNGVTVATANLPNPLQQVRQAGVWCASYGDIHIHDYRVLTEKPRAFVVMQFSDAFNDVYASVIKNICGEFGIDALRADEMYGPGVIVNDITQQVQQAKLIIADITPTNANVYFEVGYALALNKPIILLAKKGTALPFDVSGFRVLFYEDSIGGKSRVEDGLRHHLRAILGVEPQTAATV